MKRGLARAAAVVMTLCLLAAVGGFAVSAELVMYKATPKSIDSGAECWWIGQNVVCTPTGGSGFELESIDGKPEFCNIAWAFTVDQLREYPYLNIAVLNEGAAEAGVYMKLYVLFKSAAVNVPGFTSDLENWVRANAKTGMNSCNLADAMKKQLDGAAGDTQVFVYLWLDPVDTGEKLKIADLFLSNEKPGEDYQPATPTTQPASQPTTVPTDSDPTTQPPTTGGTTTKAPEASQPEDNDGLPTGAIVGICAAAVVVIAGAVLTVVVMKKKKTP